MNSKYPINPNYHPYVDETSFENDVEDVIYIEEIFENETTFNENVETTFNNVVEDYFAYNHAISIEETKPESVLFNQKLYLEPVVMYRFNQNLNFDQNSVINRDYYEIHNAIGQSGNSCWLNSCLNLLSLIPNLTTMDPIVNNLLNCIQGKNTMDYQDIIASINVILERYNKTIQQFEASDGMNILKSLIKSVSLEICVYEFPDYMPLKKFLVIPYGVINSFNSARTDIIKLTNVGQSSAEYQPIAWIFRRGNSDYGHFTVIYLNNQGNLFEIDSLSQTVKVINEFPEITNYNTVEYALYIRL